MIRKILTAAMMEARFAVWAVQDVFSRHPSKSKGEDKPRESRFHRCSLVNLEERICMSATPLSFDFDKVVAFESAHQTAVAPVTAGQTGVTLMQLSLHNAQGDNRIDSLSIQGTGDTGLNKVAGRLHVVADLNRDGLFTEAPIASVNVGSNKVVVDIPPAFERLGSFGGNLTLGFLVDTKATAPNAQIGLDVTEIRAKDAAGKSIAKSDIGLLDSNGSLVRVNAQNNELTITLLPAGRDELQLGAQEVTFGVMHVDTTEGSVSMKRIDFAVEARDETNVLTSDVRKEIAGLKLVNIRTGQTVNARGVGAGQGYLVYQAENFTVQDGDMFAIVGKLTGDASVKNGDGYRIRVNANEADTSTTTFGGLLPKAVRGYDMNAVDVDSGRKVTVVYPTGTIMGNWLRIGQTSAQVNVLMMADADNVVVNQKDVVVFRFAAHAKNGDVNVFDPIFSARDGNLVNMRNYRLFADLNGDGSAETLVGRGTLVGFGADARLQFYDMTNGGQVVSKNSAMMFEVIADVSSSVTMDNRLQLQMLDIEAERVSGGQEIPLAITSASTTTFYISKQGNLFVTQSPMPLQPQQLLAGTLGEPLMALSIRAQDEGVDVTKLTFQSMVGNASSVDRLELYKAGAMTPFATATVGATGSDPVPPGAVVFTANTQSGQLVVPEGELLTILVRPRMKTDNQGAVSDEVIQFALGKVEARGVQSSNDILQNDGDFIPEGEIIVGSNVPGPNAPVIGSKNVVVFAQIGSIQNGSSLPDGTALSVGRQTVGELRIGARSHGNTLNGLDVLELDGLIATMQMTNISFNADSFRLYNKADTSVLATGTVFDQNGVLQHGVVSGSGKYFVRFGDLIDSWVNTQIDPGQSVTLCISAEITDTRVNDALSSELHLSVDNFTDVFASMFGTDGSHLLFAEQSAGTRTFRFGVQYANTVVNMTRFVG